MHILLNPPSLQYLAQTILAGALAGYLVTRSRRGSTTRCLAHYFGAMTAGIALLFLDQVVVARGAKIFMDTTPLVFQAAGAFLLSFAYRFPEIAPGRDARWAVRAAWAAVLVDLLLAAPNLVRSWQGTPNPLGPFRLQLVMISLAALWVVVVLVRRAAAAPGLDRRERGALASFAGLGILLLTLGVMSWLTNLGVVPREVDLACRTVGFLVFLFAFVVVHLNASPEPSQLMAKLVGLSLVSTLLALALASSVLAPSQPREALLLALLMLGLPAIELVLFPLILRASLSRPLGALLAGVKRVESGDLAGEVPVRIHDEIGNLATSFNTMVHAVRDAASTRERMAAVEQELAVARRIQKNLLPECLPRVAGITTAARLVPAEAMSGDFYDAEVLPDGLSLVAVDVSGHGVPAALIAAMVKQAFSQARSQSANPGVLLASVNEALAGRIGEQFFTASCVYLDPVRGLARFGSAGHPPALLLRGGRVEMLKPAGPLAGILPGASFAETEVGLRSGDRILLYTDGVTECRAVDDEEFGDDRLADTLLKTAALSADACVDHVLAVLRAWSNQPKSFEDDVTLVVADITPDLPS